jgi:uncharacterized protein
MKYLIWFVICLAVVTWIKRKKAAFFNPQADAQGGAGANNPAVESMQQCAQCGMHIPASEAVTDGSGLIFCCQEHRAQHVVR